MRYVRYVTFAAVLILSCSLIGMAQNPIITENGNTGTTAWVIPSPTPPPTSTPYPTPSPGPTPIFPALNHEIEGYASQTSVNIGETIYFHLNVATSSSTVSFKIYRLGYYSGTGGREVSSATGISVTPQSFPTPDSTTGLAECNWPSPTGANWTVPASPTPAVSGVYLVKLMNAGLASYISFVVRDDARTSEILFQRSVTTDQAYNNYPAYLGGANNDSANGKSLYESNSYGSLLSGSERRHQARKVSFNRPYGIGSNSTDPNSPEYGRGIYNTPGGTLFSYDFQMIRWLEGNGYDITYCTDVDTHTANSTNGRLSAGKHKAFLSVGHDEYWSWEMRDNIEQARNRTSQPLNLGFFGANTCYWQIRFENSSSSSAPANASNRTIVGYKEHIAETDGDPLYLDTDATNNHLISNLWRDNVGNSGTTSKPPEDELVGIMSGVDGSLTSPPLCCGSDTAVIAASSPAWITQGTTGETLNDLIGYEVDKYRNSYSDRSLSIVGDSPFHDAAATPTPAYLDNANMTYYNLHVSGARVFATGSMQWTLGLDDFSHNSSVQPYWGGSSLVKSDAQTITANVMGCLLNINAQCGVGPADLAVWRPGTNSVWYVMAPGGTIQASASWGITGDIPVPGDYDGDGKTDFCVYRPTNHTWYIIFSSTNGMAGIPFGTAGDLIAPADYDGDGKTDIAVYRPSDGKAYIRKSVDGSLMAPQFAFSSGDIPAPADYDADGSADITVWRNSDHTFYTKRSSDSNTQSESFGASGYEPVSGDYDGDGNADYALFQSGSSAYFHIKYSTTNTVTSTQFGTANDRPVPNDYDVDGKCDIAVWRFQNSSGNTDNGNWYILNSGSGNTVLRSEHWGQTGDTPVPAYYRR